MRKEGTVIEDNNFEYKKLDKKVVLGWRIGRGITLFILALGLLAAGMFPGWVVAKLGLPLVVEKVAKGLMLALFIYKFLGLFFYPWLEYKQWGYYIDDHKVEIRHGIFFIERTVIPIVRIQHVTIEQGPINRRLGLFELTVSLASGTFTLEGLKKEVAEEISQSLREKLEKNLEAQG